MSDCPYLYISLPSILAIRGTSRYETFVASHPTEPPYPHPKVSLRSAHFHYSKTMHPTLELIRERQLIQSQPRHRQDQARLALVIEGGSSRAAFGGGMVAALEEHGLLPVFDAVYGSSAGALNGAWLICQRANENVHGWWAPESMKGTIKIHNVLLGRPVVNGEFLVDEIYENFTKMGFEEILSSDVEYHPLATDADTGKSVDLAPFINDRATLKLAMKATSRIPLLSGPPVELGGRRFIDAGMAENIPAETALAQGATHILVLRTRVPSLDLATTHPVKQKAVGRWMQKHAPGASHTWTHRNRRKQELEILLQKSEQVFQVCPPAQAPKISMVGQSQATQKLAVELGRAQMEIVLAEAGLLEATGA